MQSIKIRCYSFITIAFAIVSCSDNPSRQATQPTPQLASSTTPTTGHSSHNDTTTPPLKKAKPFTGLEFADKKDLVCGMPLTAGIADTVSYKGKLYGFCATGCKEDFVKNPKAYLLKK